LRILAIILPAVLFVAAAWYDYAQVHNSARRLVVTTADAMAEHAQKVLETNQLVLSALEERIAGMSWEDIRSSAGLHQYLVRMNNQMPQLESTFIVDPEGMIAASSRAFPMPRYDVRQRDYYTTVLGGNNGLYISKPFAGQREATFAFTVSRPVHPPGVAGGIVAVTLSPGYFERFYAALSDMPANSLASLIRSDGVFLVREPPRPNGAPALSVRSFLTPGGGPLHDGVFEGSASRSDHRRIGAVHEVAGFPLYAGYSMDARGYLSLWLQHMAVLAVFAIVLIVVLSVSARSAIRHARRERTNLRALLTETTRREEAEEAVRQLQKIEALGRLTGGVAHDFNNLLTAIMGSLELAGKRVQEPRVVRLLEGAMEAAKRGARLTQQMLAFSRQQNVQLRAISVNETLSGMDELLRRSITPEMRVQYSLDPLAWPAMADPTQLEVAVLNLAINARDAMPLGGVLALRTENLPLGAPRPAEVPAGEFVQVSISDTGAGMTEEVRRRAVEPFFTTKGVGQGTGLGLSMVHGFARQTGGAMAIDSTVGQGTSVRLFLPRATALPEPARPEPMAEDRTPPLAIVLLDDDAEVRALTAEMLRELGHRVVQFEDGPGAIAHVGLTPPDLLIIDYAMPGMNGGEVARMVTRGGARPPILFISGYTEADALQEWTARGYVLLTKPFTLPQLAGAIAASVGRVKPDNLVRFPAGRGG
jgi:signal transduction histidine kinase/ActR/RegA family two-component response regulator